MNNLQKSWIGTSSTWICHVISIENFNDILSTIILIIAIISSLGSLVASIRCWWAKSKSDGKITKEEIQEGAQIIREGVESINSLIEDKNKEDK